MSRLIYAVSGEDLIDENRSNRFTLCGFSREKSVAGNDIFPVFQQLCKENFRIVEAFTRAFQWTHVKEILTDIEHVISAKII
jgi:hypothetical protein